MQRKDESDYRMWINDSTYGASLSCVCVIFTIKAGKTENNAAPSMLLLKIKTTQEPWSMKKVTSFSGEYRVGILTAHPPKTQDPIIIPLFTKKAFWPPEDVPQLQNNVQLNNPPLSLTSALPLSLSSSALSACRRSRWQIHSTCPQSHQARGFHALTHASLPWLPQTSTPRRWTSLSIIFGLADAAFSCCKKRQGRHTRSAPFICCLELRWRLICFSSFLPFLPIRALPLAARSPRLLCAEDPPSITAIQPRCWKTNRQEEKSGKHVYVFHDFTCFFKQAVKLEF